MALTKTLLNTVSSFIVNVKTKKTRFFMNRPHYLLFSSSPESLFYFARCSNVNGDEFWMSVDESSLVTIIKGCYCYYYSERIMNKCTKSIQCNFENSHRKNK